MCSAFEEESVRRRCDKKEKGFKPSFMLAFMVSVCGSVGKS